MSQPREPRTLPEATPPAPPSVSLSPPAWTPSAAPHPLLKKLPVRGPDRSRGRPLAWLVLLLVGLAAADTAAHFLLDYSLVTKALIGPTTVARPDVILHTVRREMLVVTVTEKGTLESADNKDIVCRVRAGSKGYATTIKEVIDDGTRVKPGQLLMILDDSALRDQEEAQSIVVQQKLAEKVKAEKDYEIQVKKNESNIALARTALILAEIELDKLTGIAPDPALIGLGAVASMMATLTENGAYRQELDDLNGQISLAQANVEQNRERAAWAERMVKLSYMSPAQAQAERSRYESSLETLRSLQAKRALLISHDRRQRLTDLLSKRDNARRALEQAILEAEALEVQAYTEMQTKTSIYNQALAILEDIQKQRKECKIHAPEDIEDGSMVVYFKPETNRFGGSSTQGLIEPGAQVREGQKMLRIPNLSRMQVNTKVHEAMVARIRGEVRVPTRIVEFTHAALLFNPDPYGRLALARPEVPELIRAAYREIARTSPTDRGRDLEYEKVADGQRALIRLDSIPNKQFVGHVRSVSAVASQADFFMSDVKLYQTFVRIDGELLPDGTVLPLRDVIAREGEILKPDMTAEVTITVDAAPEPVLTVPIQSIIGGAEMGATREVFVKTPTGFERRPVTLGLYNERMVEIRSGLSEGEEVVVNPKVLLGDKDRTKTREVNDLKGERTKGSEAGSESRDKTGRGGGPKGKGNGGPGPGGPPTGPTGGDSFPKAVPPG